jgi:plastocyanin
VSIDNFTFQPETLEVTAGTKVVWVNGDDVPHTVRSTEDLFRSGTLDTDDVYEHVFSEPGTYEYYCGVHRHMTGKIVVK